MAQGRDTISQRISIEGALDVINQLKDLGAAGEAAIKQIREATESSGGATSRVSELIAKGKEQFEAAARHLEPLKESLGHLRERGQQFGESLRQVAERTVPHFEEVARIAFAGSLVGLGLLVKEAANYTNELHKVADEVNLNVQKYQELNFVLRATGIEEPRVIATFTRLARTVGAAVVAAREHLKELGSDLLGDTSINNIVLGDPKKIADNFTRSIREGISNNKDVLKAAEQLRDATRKVFEETGQDQTQLPQLDFFIQKIKKAYTDLTPEAAKIRTELYRFTDLNIPAKTISELYDRTKEAGNEVDVLFRRKLHVAFQDANGQARNLSDIFKDVGNSLSEMKDSGTQAFYAQLVFNRGFKDFLPLFDNHSHHIRELEEQYRELGVSFSDLEIKSGVELFQAFSRLNIVLENLKTKFLLVFSPDIVELMNSLNEAIKHNVQTIIQFAERMRADLQPGLKEINELLRGQINQNQLTVQWVKTLVAGFKDVREIVFALAAAFRTFISVMDRVANVINSVFGTHFTGAQLAAIAIVGQLIGVFGVLSSAITIVGAAVGVLVAAFGGIPTAIIVGIAAAAAAILAFWPEIKQGASDTAAWLQRTFENAWTGITHWIVTSLESAGKYVHDTLAEWGNWISDLWKKVTGLLGAIGSGAGKALGGAPSGFSGGGGVPGSGSGDHVPALLEPGEYVVRRSAVNRVGTGFMHALNSGMLGGFSLGGIVESLRSIGPTPLRFAEGGLVPAGSDGSRTFHLTIEGRTFQGLSAPASVHRELENYARTSSMASTGKKPSWHGSG